MNRSTWRCGILVTWVCVAAAVFAQDEFPEMSGFRVPEYDKDGIKKSEITGDFARMAEGGTVQITNLKIEFYDPDGEVTARITSPQCTYDQKRQVAFSDSSVRMERGNMTVTGTGFRWKRDNEVFEILHDAKVVIQDVRTQMETEENP